jgi:8-oxo-dGTP diphosphatase
MAVPKTPPLTTDCVVNRQHKSRVDDPATYEGRLALPGGFVEVGETVESAARRELSEETGVNSQNLRLIGVYSARERN